MCFRGSSHPAIFLPTVASGNPVAGGHQEIENVEENENVA